MLKKNFIVLSLAGMLSLSACTPQEVLNQIGTIATEVAGSQELSIDQIVMGLKEALNKGINTGVSKLAVKGGFLNNPEIKIPIPQEAQKVVEKLRFVPGFDNVESELVRLLNVAAEDAVKSAKPIFGAAIRQMTFQDAKSILMGNDNEATDYLKRTTSSELFKAFQPKVKTSLNTVKLADYWAKIIGRYNQIPLVNKVDTELDVFVTEKAMAGIFNMVEKEETAIRKDPAARTSEILKRVFAAQDNK